MCRLLSLSLLCLCLCVSTAKADINTIFTDSFTQDTAQFGSQWIVNPWVGLNNTNFANWNVTRGSVDIKQVVSDHSYFFDHGVLMNYRMPFIDLDGTTNQSGQITTKNALNLQPGTYTLTFDLGGNHGRDKRHSDGVTVRLGDLVNTHYDLPWTQQMTPQSISFTVATATSAFLSFANESDDPGSLGDNQGPLLGNIRLTGVLGGIQNVPEPSTLIILGSFAIGACCLYRRRKVKA